jgi:hypothetical protein
VVTDAQSTKRADQSPAPIDKLYMEKTLLRISGALFCHDPKRARTRTREIELNRGVAEKQIVIRPDPRLGQPGPLAHKIFVAIIKKHSDYGRPVQSDVSFTKRELMRLIGRKEWGGSANEQLARALNEIHYAFVRANFKGNDGRHVEQSFNIFPEVYLERAEFATDPIEKCVVTLARPIVASLQDGHFTCLNHVLMQHLGTIGQALYMRLFFHFANLYDGHHRNRLAFPKRYDDICNEWLGGLTVHKHKSIIERDQLGPHLGQLADAGFLVSHHITRAADGDGFVVTFRPGVAFFTDYDRFYRRHHQGDLQFDFHTDRNEVAEPLRVAYLFIERRTGQPIKDIPYVSSKDVDTAKQFLARVKFAEIPDFLDYALAEARKTNFDVQTLGGLKQYLPAYFSTRERREAAKATTEARQAREREEAVRLAYDRFKRSSADAVFAALPAGEQSIIENLARGRNGAGFAGRTGPLATTMFEIARGRITAERHGDKIPSFEQWRPTRRAA